MLDAEGDRAIPNSFGDNGIGEDASRAGNDGDATPDVGAGNSNRRPRIIIIGVFLMTLVLGLLAAAILTPGRQPNRR